MNYETLQLLPATAFRRNIGIDRHLFTQLVETLAQAERLKKKRGRPRLKPRKSTLYDVELLARISYVLSFGVELWGTRVECLSYRESSGISPSRFGVTGVGEA